MRRALGWSALIAAAALFVVESVLDRRRRRQKPGAPSATTIKRLVSVGMVLLVVGAVLVNG